MIFAGLMGMLIGGAVFFLIPRRGPVMAREWNRPASSGGRAKVREALQSGDEGLLRAGGSTSRELGEARVRMTAVAVPAGGLGVWLLGFMIGLPAMPMAVMGCLFGALLGYFLPMSNIRQAATVRRRQLADGTAVFLDIASVMMKGGLQVETALLEASEIGEGPVFAEFREAMAVARQQKKPILHALADVGDWYGVPELSDLRRTAIAAASSGTGVTESLSRSAEELRKDRLRRLRIKAERNLTALQLPTTALVFILMGYLMYGLLGQGVGT